MRLGADGARLTRRMRPRGAVLGSFGTNDEREASRGAHGDETREPFGGHARLRSLPPCDAAEDFCMRLCARSTRRLLEVLADSS